MRLARVLLSFTLAGAVAAPPASAAAETADPDLAKGIRQVQEGDFESALVTLDGVVRSLAGRGGRAEDLAQAYLHLAIAYLGLSQETAAKAKFLEALKNDGDMTLSPSEFPPRVIRLFEQARAEMGKKEAAAAAPPAPAPPPQPPKKGGGSGKVLLIVGGGAALAGVAVAVGGGGGDADGGTSPVSPTVAPTTTAPPAAGNQAPSVRLVDVQPSGAFITFVTNGGFSAMGSDPDGDVLSYAWDWGDGSPVLQTGAGASHVYESECNCLVRVTVTDGKGGTGSDTRNLRAEKITGNWRASFSSGPNNVATSLEQARTDISGEIGSIGFSGRLNNPRGASLTLRSSSCSPPGGTYTGSVNESLSRINLSAPNPASCGGGTVNLTLTR